MNSGATPEGWLAARVEMEQALGEASAVLLAYGLGEPTGSARAHFREQVAWLHEHIEQHDLPTWWVGGAPRHPSRWQRYTWRAYPDLAFPEGLRAAFSTTSQR